jgi:hypothetical protein
VNNKSVFANYDFKKRIEKLFLWFLPTFVLSVIFQFLVQKFLKYTVDQGIVKGTEFGESISSVMLFSYGIGFLDNIVIAIWLYFQAKDLRYNKMLWPILGLFEVRLALIAFIGVTIFSTYQETTFNKNMKADD